MPEKHEPSLRSDGADVECICIPVYKVFLRLWLLERIDGGVSEPGKMRALKGICSQGVNTMQLVNNGCSVVNETTTAREKWRRSIIARNGA